MAFWVGIGSIVTRSSGAKSLLPACGVVLLSDNTTTAIQTALGNVTLRYQARTTQRGVFSCCGHFLSFDVFLPLQSTFWTEEVLFIVLHVVQCIQLLHSHSNRPDHQLPHRWASSQTRSAERFFVYLYILLNSVYFRPYESRRCDARNCLSPVGETALFSTRALQKEALRCDSSGTDGT